MKYKAITFYINNASTTIGVFRQKFRGAKLLPENVNSLKETWGEKITWFWPFFVFNQIGKHYINRKTGHY
ncbi:MAG: hypothetical protein DRR19_01495 [Candidatus Parabeggiatoa sp. nov. 1]|nr:MAG: hypothetical protein DRR19_01495 [Gammaproteobacteria bacterium]